MLHYLVRLPMAGGAEILDRVRDNHDLITKNERLARRNTLLSVQLNEIESLKDENKHLRKLLHSTRRLENKEFMVAELIRANKATARHHFLINKGRRDGVIVGQPILDADGILGQIVSATPYTSTGILITDANYSLQVKLKRLGLRMLAVGTGVPNKMVLRYVPNDTEVMVDDVVVSSGLDELYPPDFAIGRVTSVNRVSGDGFAEIVVTPSAVASRNREVLLLRSHGEAS